jgi:hypothetical protein
MRNDFLNYLASQIKKDACTLYGALLSACQGGVGRRTLMVNRCKQVISMRQTTIGMLELRSLKTSSQLFSIDIIKEAYFYEDAFTELILLGQKTWNDDDIRKRRLVQNAQNIGMVDTVFEAVVSDKSFLETCNFLRSNVIRHDQQSKEKNARQNKSTSQSPGTSKKDKIKTVLALFNEL